MEDRLSQDYLDRITRSVGGTVAKPATVNVRSDAASLNEAATAVAGAGPGVPAWKAACHIDQAKDGSFNLHSPTRSHFYTSISGWHANPTEGYDRHAIGSYSREYATRLLDALHTCPPDWPTPAHTDDPREEPERFCEATGPWNVASAIQAGPNTSTNSKYQVTYPDGSTAKLDKLPTVPQAFTTIKPKPVDSIEKLIDRLAKVNGAIDIGHGMMFRVTGQVEKAEPRTHDEPGYPEHFALHHVYLPEELTRDILASMSSDLTSKLDKGTLRTVLESAARALLLTGSLDEADLLGLAVAVEDKLDIGK